MAALLPLANLERSVRSCLRYLDDRAQHQKKTTVCGSARSGVSRWLVGDSSPTKPPVFLSFPSWTTNFFADKSLGGTPLLTPLRPRPPSRGQPVLPITNNQVGLVEALHDHLKGKLAAAAVTLGGALDGQAGYGGVCADGEGVFLKAALLYLSSEEVQMFFFGTCVCVSLCNTST